MTGTNTHIFSVFLLLAHGLRSITTSLPEDCGKTRFKIDNGSAPRIVQGDQACLGEFPWMARLGVTGHFGTSFVCGGSLISIRYVISVAHCRVCDTVRLGENDLDTDPDCDKTSCAPTYQDIKIKKLISHPNFINTAQGHDYSLIILEKVAELNEFVQPICFPTGPVPHADLKSEYLYIAGWGYINKTDKYDFTVANHLMYITAPLLDHEPCNTLFERKLLDSQLCIGYASGKDSCSGDSGGPVFKAMFKDNDKEKRFHLIGLVSYGLTKCGGGPAVYTDVSQYAEWTLQTIEKS